ncbi:MULTISPECIES: hypothetical protein [unclassified Pseudofrankia]|nr:MULTISPECIES: hypothetical protein [unclassified Pseudofrankia]MDT3443863.1 hypothetical protein [Pseudofrankia sp. BMG5.37]
MDAFSDLHETWPRAASGVADAASRPPEYVRDLHRELEHNHARAR